MWTPQRRRRQWPPRSGRRRRSIALLNLQATAEPTTAIAIGLETVGGGVTGARDLRRANGPTAPSALLVMAETAGRLDMASLGSETERHTPRSQFLSGRVRPI